MSAIEMLRQASPSMNLRICPILTRISGYWPLRLRDSSPFVGVGGRLTIARLRSLPQPRWAFLLHSNRGPFLDSRRIGRMLWGGRVVH
jgi:hypothetical protein